MADSLPPTTLAWLRQSAAVDGAAYSQVLLHLLERVEALEKKFDEGQTQRGNGHGGPTTPKPPIKPQPHGGRQVGDLLKPQFPPPRKIREDFL
jgi:hypothetical protein